MFKFNTKTGHNVVGVDISSTAVRLIQLSHRGDRFQVEAYASLPIDEHWIVDKNIVDGESIAEVVEGVYNLANPSTKQVALAVPTLSVITKIIEMDADISEDEREIQIRMDAEQYIPYPIDEVSLDFEQLQTSTRNPNRVNVLLVATRTENVDRRAEIIDLASLKPKIVDVESFALERAYRLVADSLPIGAKVVAVLDIGHHQTIMNILDDGQVIYNREFSFGGKQLTQDIQQRYGLSAQDADVAKILRALPDDYDTEVLYPFIDALSQQAARSLQLFFSSSQYNSVDHILLAGGSANIAGLTKVLQDQLGYRVTLVNPFLRMSYAAQVNFKQLEQDASSLLVATGLALRSFD